MEGSTTQRTEAEKKAARKSEDKGLVKMIAIVVTGMAILFCLIVWASGGFAK